MELILALVVISMVLALAAPSLRGFAASRQTAEAAMKTLALTRWASREAIALGRPCRLNIDPQGGACWLTVQRGGTYVPPAGEAGKRIEVPEGARVRLRPTAENPSPSCVEFHPSGRSDAATIEITGRQGEVFLVACDSPTDPFRVISPAEAANP